MYWFLQKFKLALCHKTLVNVIHVNSDHSIDEVLSIFILFDDLLLDSGNPNLTIQELGWTVSVYD